MQDVLHHPDELRLTDPGEDDVLLWSPADERAGDRPGRASSWRRRRTSDETTTLGDDA